MDPDVAGVDLSDEEEIRQALQGLKFEDYLKYTNQTMESYREGCKESAKDHDPAYWYRSKTSNVGILTSSSIE